MKRIAMQMAIVALLSISITTTAWAEAKETVNPLSNLYQRVDSSDINGFETVSMTEFKYKGNRLSEKQIKLLEGMSCDVKGMEVTKNNVTIKPIKVIGDKNFAYTIFEVTANNGRKLDGGMYYIGLNEVNELGYPIVDSATLPADVIRGDVNVEIIKDENPQDNKLWLVSTTDLTKYEDVNLEDKNLYYNIAQILEVFGSNSDVEGKSITAAPGDKLSANASVVGKGPWVFSIPLKYSDKAKTYTFNKTVKEKIGSQTVESLVDTVEISPISIVVKGMKKYVDRAIIPISLKKKDGTVIKMDVSGGFTDGDFRATSIFKEPIDLVEIQSVIIADTNFLLK